MRVDVQRDRDVRVPHEFLHDFNVLAVAFEERRICVRERMPAKIAHESDLFRRWFQVRFVERAWPVRQFSSAVRASKYPILIGRVGTLQPPVPQDLGQSQIEWNRFARGFRFAIANVLHDDRANDMDHRYRESPLSQTLGVVPENGPQAGDRFPWLCLKFHPEGPREDLFQRLDDTRFNLLLIGQPAGSLGSLQFGDMLQMHEVPSDTDNDSALAAASIGSPSYYLLRPDGHIGLAGTIFREADLRQWLVRSRLRLESTTSQKMALAG